MKILSILLASIVIVPMALGAPIDFVTSSALMPGDSALFNLDFVDPFGLPGYSIILNARQSGSGDQYQETMEHIGMPPYYTTTYRTSIAFDNPAGEIKFYGRVEADTFVITQSYDNPSNQFPPNNALYAGLADDAVGDTPPGSDGDWLDLTGSGITYSDTRIYASMNNGSGTWPTGGSFGTYYVYGFVLVNTDTLSLSGTAMIYSNIPFILQPGLYHVNIQDSSFQYLGPISHQVSGGKLHMACDINDLLADPNWDVWPPESGFLFTAGFTITAALGEQTFNDFTYPSVYLPTTQTLDTDNNTPPILLSPLFSPRGDTALIVGITYHDEDNNLPVEKHLWFDGNEYEMGSVTHIYDHGSAGFSRLLEWPGEGWHTYSYRFSDGAEVVQTELDSIYLGATGMVDPPVPDEFFLYQNYPNPFNSSTAISFSLPQSCDVSLKIFDVNGRAVKALVSNRLDAGFHSVVWDGLNGRGEPVASGIYFVTLNADRFSSSKRLLLLK